MVIFENLIMGTAVVLNLLCGMIVGGGGVIIPSTFRRDVPLSKSRVNRKLS